MADETDATVASLKFLSDRNRLRILQMLATRESCVCELIDELDVPQPLVSYHLRRLREAGLVRSRRRAQWVYYSIEPDRWERFTRPIRGLCGPAILPPEAAYGANEACADLAPATAPGASDRRRSPWPEE